MGKTRFSNKMNLVRCANICQLNKFTDNQLYCGFNKKSVLKRRHIHYVAIPFYMLLNTEVIDIKESFAISVVLYMIVNR